MDFRILGDLRVGAGDVSCVPSAPKPRQLLSLLLLNANEFVSTDACAEELWDGNPPRTMTATLHTYIRQLRKLLAAPLEADSLPHARGRLVTGQRGYLLKVGEAEFFDLREFTKLTKEGRAAQDDSVASDLLRQALDLCRGPVLNDVHPGPRLRSRINALDEARRFAAEQCFAAELRLGRHHGLLSDLCEAAEQDPLNESLQGLYMLALFRSGRQVQALSVFRRTRETLRASLGLEPSARIRRLNDAILTSDPRLDLPCPQI
ncbi:AfsR/SARP family transcriptional regulator [Saccharopolyspora taberi]|uniref:OmpR/PhoB-type domain-containing protein n=1 Tax=Saccharopolyspora taberi TaxID=60895 RepID=A0ABN3V9V3_9PSEU